MDWLKILTTAAQEIKNAITPILDKPIAQKTYGVGAGGDPQKHIDLQAEKALIETLIKHDLKFTLISEESGVKQYGQKPTYYVTVDPIDGTTNVLRGIPFACTSIAISKKPYLMAVEAAIVADIFHETTYLAQKRRGAYCNGKKISPRQMTNLNKVVMCLDLNTYKIADLIIKLNKLLTQTKHIRHFGANALELCYVADGTIDGFIDLRGHLRTTDIAAATHIVKEAGATITTPQNTPLENPLSPTERVAFIAAGTPKLHQTILKNLKGA
jgi:myo-inositol-1(or 4)-monophosphatase